MEDLSAKAFQVGSVFTPRSAINEADLFAGRLDQIAKVVDAITQRGSHAVLYGERGVGKTSLSNVLSSFLQRAGQYYLVSRVNCDASDDYSSLWRRAFTDINMTKTKAMAGFADRRDSEVFSLASQIPQEITPDVVRRMLAEISSGTSLVLIFDEFDRLVAQHAKALMADTIKSLSDYGVPVTMVVIGVADSVDQLVEGHLSIERALIQIPMPRMSVDEIAEIVQVGLNRLGMDISERALDEIAHLSQGLPYITHLLALHSAQHVLRTDHATTIGEGNLRHGIEQALKEWQQSIKSAYYDATKSQQPGALYPEVLLACALAEKDEFGYFSAAAVRGPLRTITGKDYDIPNFARHLKELSEPGRGNVLQKMGEMRRTRYRFSGPLIQPYIIMKSFVGGSLPNRILDS